MRQRKEYFTFSKLADAPASDVIIRLMIASNDLSSCLLIGRRLGEMKISSEFEEGTHIYLTKMEIGHFNEALDAVRALGKNKTLLQVLEKCPSSIRKAYDRLLRCAPGNVDNKKFLQRIDRIRNAVSFHYANKPIQDALRHRATKRKGNQTSVSVGTEHHHWRFEVADQLVATVLIDGFWKKSNEDGDDLKSVVEWCQGRINDFLLFSAAFIHRYLGLWIH